MPFIGGDFAPAQFVPGDFDVGSFVRDPATGAACAGSSAPDICPTLDECHAQIIASLPRGRAWSITVNDVRWRFFRAFADVVAWANERICAAREEFFCSTYVETNDAWMTTYGLPEPCDPYQRVCDKVAATGGQTCAYLVAMAARAGFSVECVDLRGAEAACMEAGCAEASPPWSVEGMLGLRVNAYFSSSIGTLEGTAVEADIYEAGQPIACGPDISRLQCLMDRIAPAHLQIVYIIA